MVGFDEEGLVDPRVVQVMRGCSQQTQEDVVGCQRLGELQEGKIIKCGQRVATLK